MAGISENHTFDKTEDEIVVNRDVDGVRDRTGATSESIAAALADEFPDNSIPATAIDGLPDTTALEATVAANESDIAVLNAEQTAQDASIDNLETDVAALQAAGGGASTATDFLGVGSYLQANVVAPGIAGTTVSGSDVRVIDTVGGSFQAISVGTWRIMQGSSNGTATSSIVLIVRIA